MTFTFELKVLTDHDSVVWSRGGELPNINITQASTVAAVINLLSIISDLKEEKEKMADICPHYIEATDGVHCLVIGRCDCKGKLPAVEEKWEG